MGFQTANGVKDYTSLLKESFILEEAIDQERGLIEPRS